MKKNHNQKPKTFLIKNINLFKNYFERKKVFPFLTSTDLPNKKANGVYVPNSRLAPGFASYRSCCFEKNQRTEMLPDDRGILRPLILDGPEVLHQGLKLAFVSSKAEGSAEACQMRPFESVSSLRRQSLPTLLIDNSIITKPEMKFVKGIVIFCCLIQVECNA